MTDITGAAAVCVCWSGPCDDLMPRLAICIKRSAGYAIRVDNVTDQLTAMIRCRGKGGGRVRGGGGGGGVRRIRGGGERRARGRRGRGI